MKAWRINFDKGNYNMALLKILPNAFIVNIVNLPGQMNRFLTDVSQYIEYRDSHFIQVHVPGWPPSRNFEVMWAISTYFFS